MTPEQNYKNAIKKKNFFYDPQQEQAVQLTQQLYQKLIQEQANRQSPNKPGQFFRSRLNQLIHNKWLSQKHRKNQLAIIKGLYFWGEVGRGKTWVVDNFYKSLPFSNKQRIHFHPFMQGIHQQLKKLPKTPDPLPIIARQMSQQFRVLCLDEFHIHDITDAMLLAGLLKALYSEGVVLVTSSNVAPEDLYKNGLQRDNFLPAIELIKHYSQEFELTNDIDYRTVFIEEGGDYLNALNQKSNTLLLQYYLKISRNVPVKSEFVTINKRPIQVVAINHITNRHPQNIVWFEFDELCNTHRSNSDYQEIARQFSHIIIANIYLMDEQKDDIAKRFIHLIDALYDHHCILKISATTEPDALYIGRRLKKPFQRTASRLKEMRSIIYHNEEY